MLNIQWFDLFTRDKSKLCFIVRVGKQMQSPFLPLLFPSSPLFSAPPPLLAFSPLFSSHCITCLAQSPVNFLLHGKYCFFYLLYANKSIQYSQHQLKKKKKSLVTFFSHIHAARLPTVRLALEWWKCLSTLAFRSLLSRGFLWVLIEAN